MPPNLLLHWTLVPSLHGRRRFIQWKLIPAGPLGASEALPLGGLFRRTMCAAEFVTTLT
jgi:hypothetical protein